MKFKNELMKILEITDLNYKILYNKAQQLDNTFFSELEQDNNTSFTLHLSFFQEKLINYYKNKYNLHLKTTEVFNYCNKESKFLYVCLVLIIIPQSDDLNIPENIAKYLNTFLVSTKSKACKKLRKVKKDLKRQKEEFERYKLLNKESKSMEFSIDYKIFKSMEEEICLLKQKLEYENKIIINAWNNLFDEVSKKKLY